MPPEIRQAGKHSKNNAATGMDSGQSGQTSSLGLTHQRTQSIRFFLPD
jgi:hypothetical protein